MSGDYPRRAEELHKWEANWALDVSSTLESGVRRDCKKWEKWLKIYIKKNLKLLGPQTHQWAARQPF